MRRDLVSRLDALEGRPTADAPPRRIGPLMVLPDNDSDGSVDPRWLGDGDPSWPVHVVRDDGTCRQCDVRHFDERDANPSTPDVDPSTPSTEAS